MSITNSIIVSPERLQADAMAALGLTSPQVGYICGNSHGKINMWCKYKPTRVAMAVCRSGSGGATLLDIDSLGHKYWQGTDGNCGLAILWYSQLSDMSGANLGTANGWTYLAPLGGSTSPYRMGDLIGYSTAVSATSGIGVVVLQGTSFTVGDTGATLIFSPLQQSDYALGYADIASLKDCKFGAYLTKVGTSKATSVMAAATVLNGGDYVVLSGNNSSRPTQDEIVNSDDGTSETLSDGTWLIHPYLYNMSTGQYCAIPYVASKEGVVGATNMQITVKPKDSGVTISMGVYDYDGLSATIKITVKSESYITLSSNSLYIRKLENTTTNTALEMGEKIYSLGDVTITAGGSYTWTKVVLLDSTILSDGFTAIASLGGAQYQYVWTEYA